MGSVIGHEMSHAFSVADVDAATADAYRDRVRCFVDQYDAFRPAELAAANGPVDDAVGLNGSLTVDENVADNGGLRQAFRAYQVRSFGPY